MPGSAKLSVAGSMGDSGYDFRVGYIDESETLTASGAFSMGQGTSVAVAWSQKDSTDHEYQYVELDQSYGDGSVGVYFKRGEMGGKDGTHVGRGRRSRLSGEAPPRMPASGTSRRTGWRILSLFVRRDARDVQLSAPDALKAS